MGQNNAISQMGLIWVKSSQDQALSFVPYPLRADQWIPKWVSLLPPHTWPLAGTSETEIKSQRLSRETDSPCGVTDSSPFKTRITPSSCTNWVILIKPFSLAGTQFYHLQMGKFFLAGVKVKVITIKCVLCSKSYVKHMRLGFPPEYCGYFVFISILPVFDDHSFYLEIPGSPSFLRTWYKYIFWPPCSWMEPCN